MNALSRSFLQRSPALPPGLRCGPLTAFPERIVQFGEGNFLRAFADVMIDELNGRGLLGSSVLVVQPIRQGLAGVLNAQDGLYTALTRGVQNGQVVESRRIVTAVRRALDPYAQWAELVRAFTGDELRFVLSNTTEAGIAYVEEPLAPGRCPESFPAKVAALLHARWQAGGTAARGLVFLPCELIERNGTQLRAAVLRHAAAWQLPAGFVAWVGQANHFCNTLVDQIVPGYPKTEAAELTAQLRYEDKLLVAAELFHLWVIEGPAHLAAELPFAAAGLNVVWTDDLTPYRNRKVRVLNGAHTSSVLAAYAAGAVTVREMMEDDLLGAFVQRAVFDEIVPHVAQPPAERAAYAEAVLERFRNPFVRHELLSISLNSVSKWKVRVLPSLLDHAAARGTPPPLLGFSLAALIWFYRGQRNAAGAYEGRRDGESYPLRDDAPVLEFFAAAWVDWDHGRDWRVLATQVLSRLQLWERDLTQIPGLLVAVTEDLATIHEQGMRAAIAAALDRASATQPVG
ncbi:MAG: tagaturonate reductase [Candidatus Didemnitutus sp.]|nr:tagaturonate reductase [Candidatus Didemnitutus sp.]